MAETVPPWLATMRDISGTKETSGSGDNPEILRWSKVIGDKFPDLKAYARTYTSDSIPWCGQAVAYCMAVNGIKPPTTYLWARDWAKWGKKLAKPEVGCVMVFTRSGGGHVALYEGEDATHYRIRGGNQSDAVNVARQPKGTFIAAVWPKAVSIGTDAPKTTPAVNFRSFVKNGFFSSTPFDINIPTAIRTNNPGAINAAPWVKAYPGYVGDKVTSMSGASPNNTAIFETPEQGVALWWELLSRYRTAGIVTVAGIINRYGGGQNYSEYLNFVVKQTGLPGSFEIKLNDDSSLLVFAKAMFRYEAGKPTPLRDAQILYGFKFARSHAANPAAKSKIPVVIAPVVVGAGVFAASWTWLVNHPLEAVILATLTALGAYAVTVWYRNRNPT